MAISIRINENEGQGILQDLTDSKAVQDLKTNALNTINEVKGKGVGNTMEEVTSEVLGKGESMLEDHVTVCLIFTCPAMIKYRPCHMSFFFTIV